MGHEGRAHALLSASGAYRWIACTPSAMLEAQFPDTTSRSAKEGTLAHELAEAKLRHYFYTQDFGRKEYNAVVRGFKKDELWQDEMLEHTETYKDYVKAAALKFESTPYVAIEKQVHFGTCVPDGFGTADCILIGGGVIHVIDFKYGQSPNGRVEAVGNPQMMLYALGAYDAYRILYEITTVRMSIVQPRLPDGITEWEIPLSQLKAHADYIRERAALAAKGAGDFNPGEKTCQFCRAKGTCRARADQNIMLAFSEDLGKKPPLISVTEMGEYLQKGMDVAKWLTDLQECALAECLAGKEVPGWKAVEGRGPRAWTDMDEAFAALEKSGIDEAVLWERKPLTLAQVEKEVGKKLFAETVGSFVIKQPGKPALVPESDKRPAITNTITAEEAFKEDLNHE